MAKLFTKPYLIIYLFIIFWIYVKYGRQVRNVWRTMKSKTFTNLSLYVYKKTPARN